MKSADHMSGPSEGLLHRARELVEAIPNRRALAGRLKSEGYAPGEIEDALTQVFAERKSLKRAGSLHEQALSRLLAGEELSDAQAAKALGRVARKRRESLLAIWRLYGQKQKQSLKVILGIIVLSLLCLPAGECGSAIGAFAALGIGSVSYLCYVTRVRRRYGSQLAALNQLAERYSWWGPEGPEE